MRSKATLRRYEQIVVLLAWLWFVAGTIGVLALSAAALFAARPPAPEAFLIDLAAMLAAMLLPVFALRGVAALLRRRRMQLRQAETGLFAHPLEDSTIGP